MMLPDKIGGFDNNPEEESHSSLEKAALEFYNAVASSKTYSWMGLYETEDELQRQRLVVYLHKRPLSSTETRQPTIQKTKDVGEAFENLYFALPSGITLNLYYNFTKSEDEKELIQSCLNDVQKRYGTENHIASAGLLSSDSFL